jgi:hypothetical protein
MKDDVVLLKVEFETIVRSQLLAHLPSNAVFSSYSPSWHVTYGAGSAVD